METIEQRVKKTAAEIMPFEGREDYRMYKAANEHYESLVKEGVVSRRGYCLKTISDTPVFKHDKNAT